MIHMAPAKGEDYRMGNANFGGKGEGGGDWAEKNSCTRGEHREKAVPTDIRGCPRLKRLKRRG